MEKNGMFHNFNLKLSFPFLLIFFLMIGGSIFSYFYSSSWEDLRNFHLTLQNFHLSHPIWTVLLFMGIYILYALFSLPGIFVLSLVAGFLFSQPFSTIYVTLAATIGASLLFWTARTAFKELLSRQSGYFISQLKRGFHKNPVSYLLFLRLIPLFPFWIVNLAGAFFSVSFWVFVWTTFIGMIPSVFIYTEAGKGLSFLLESPDPLNPIHLFHPQILIPLIALALLSLLPILFKKL